MNFDDETLNTAKKCGTGLMCLRCDGTSLTTQFPGLDALVRYCSPLPHRMSHGPKYLCQRGKRQFGNPKWNQQEKDWSRFSLSCTTLNPSTCNILFLSLRDAVSRQRLRDSRDWEKCSRTNGWPLITTLSMNATGMLINLQPH